jgi:hypothetical protein
MYSASKAESVECGSVSILAACLFFRRACRGIDAVAKKRTAVSVDAFSVICAADTLAMTNWEARARLALERISRWRDWDKGAATRGAGSATTGVDLEAIGLSGHSRGGESV